MADLLLPSLVKIVVEKSGDSLVQKIGEMWGIADQRERLRDKLLAVQAVLTDAVKSWLSKLKSATYEIRGNWESIALLFSYSVPFLGQVFTGDMLVKPLQLVMAYNVSRNINFFLHIYTQFWANESSDQHW